MKGSDYYKNEIIEMVSNTDDPVFLRRLNKLIQIIVKIDDDWMLSQLDRFINSVRR